MSAENLKLWNRVEKTNPKYTKNANVRGNKITSISPQFQIMNVTAEFGVYGEKWGFKKLDFDYSLSKDFGLVVLSAVFFFPGGEFEIKNSINLYIDNARTKIDSDFAKKIETDTLTKAISKLGFNADIFMGKFDDTRYVAEMNEEFKEPTILDIASNEMRSVANIDDLKTVWLKYKSLQTNTEFVKAKDKRKEELTQIKAE